MKHNPSSSWLSRAKAVTPGGSQTISKQPSRFGDGAYPDFAVRGCGAVVYDVDGRSYVDWIAAQGALTLGHAHPAVVEAVERQLRDGVLFSLPHTLECEVAERLTSLVPCAAVDGMVRWTKTASEACAGAVRVARLATGRSVILVATPGYHGWHDWFSVTQPFRDGIPAEFGHVVRAFRYNDVCDFERVLAESPPASVAAIMLEPARDDMPESGYLAYLRERAFGIGALLVFDETILGFRLARAGGQEYFGVIPDLAVFGKAIAGGLPLACLVGPRSLMKHAVIVSSTFGGDCLALAAARATMDVYDREPVIERLRENSRLFADSVAREAGLLARCGGFPARLTLRWSAAEAARGFVQEMAARGVLVHPEVVNTSAAMEPHEVQTTQGALREALAVVRS